MANRVKLTWGFTLCNLKLPGRSLSTSTGSNTLGRTGHSSKKCSRASKPENIAIPIIKHAKPNELEFTLLVNPRTFAAQCLLKNPPYILSGRRSRILIYLVSLALSLAALIILKLHGFLEWLLLSVDGTDRIDPFNGMQNLAHWIEEVLREASSIEGIVPSSHRAHLLASSVAFTLDPLAGSRAKVACPMSPPSTPSTPEPSSGGCRFSCPHAATSGCCLHCYMRLGPDWPSQAFPFSGSHGDVVGRQLHRPPLTWAPPTFVNAGISRAQVSGRSKDDALIIESCSPHLAHRQGLDLAAGLANRVPPNDRSIEDPFPYSQPRTPPTSISQSRNQLSEGNKSLVISKTNSHTFSDTSNSSIRRPNISSKLVACIAPTNKNSLEHASTLLSVRPSTSNEFDGPSKEVGFPLLEADEYPTICALCAVNTLHGKYDDCLFTDSGNVLACAEATSTNFFDCDKSFVSVDRPPVQRRNIGVMSTLSGSSSSGSRQDVCQIGRTPYDYSNSDIDGGDNEGLELDDDGVWLLSSDDMCIGMSNDNFDPSEDIINLYRCPNYMGAEKFSPLQKIDFPNSQNFQSQIPPISQSPLSSAPSRKLSNPEYVQSRKLSRLVTLTSGISEDLSMLEHGCQDLIYRLQANRIELDSVRDGLGNAWNVTDSFFHNPHGSVYSEGPTVPQTVQELHQLHDTPKKAMSMLEPLDINVNYSQPLFRSSPLGRSFVSESKEIPNQPCSCHCHVLEHSTTPSPSKYRIISGLSGEWSPLTSSPAKRRHFDLLDPLGGRISSTESLLTSLRHPTEDFVFHDVCYEYDDLVMEHQDSLQLRN